MIWFTVIFGEDRQGRERFSLMHLYIKTVCMTQYKAFKQKKKLENVNSF